MQKLTETEYEQWAKTNKKKRGRTRLFSPSEVDEIKKYRAKGWSRTFLAERLNCSVNTIRNAELSQ